MTLDPFKPIPWETFTPIPSPITPTHGGLSVRMFGWMCVLAAVGGALWAAGAIWA